METQYFKDYSPALEREMECKLYGHAGRPVLFVPCQDGRFFDFENFHMTDTWAPWIESGQAMVLAIDTLDQETWSNSAADPGWRAWRHERWMDYLTQEIAPFLRNLSRERNQNNNYHQESGIIAFGCSLGATHAVNLYLRRPDLFDGLLALSGIYDAAYGFGNYMDENVYMNSPVHYMANLPEDHPYISMFNQQRAVICVGQGDWEQPETTFALADILAQKNIHTWVDIWGHDCVHDWPWWYKQTAYFVPWLLGGNPG